MNKHFFSKTFLSKKLSNARIGQRLLISMMVVITILVIPLILVMTSAMNYRARYNSTLENLSNISYIIQETKNQGYRILDYCTMGMNIEESGEAEIIVQMLDKVSKIRDNIGTGERYRANLDQLQIVDNLLQNYADSYKTGVGKCGETFSLAGDMDFYSMVDTANFIINNCNELLSLEMNRSEDLKNDISATFRTMLFVVSVIVVIVILLMILFVYTITESITYPLGLLMSHISDIEKSGLLDDDVSISAQVKSETASKIQEGKS